MKKKLIYNGRSSADMGLVIQAPPAYSVPERDVETTHVPGRNGDIIEDNGCYKNSTREYSLAKDYSKGPVKTTVNNAQELYEWLTSAKGKYVRLEDDYDPNVYRIATYIDSGSVGDIFDKGLTFNARFICKPQRFLKLGEQEIDYPSETTNVNIDNLTHYEAKPKIKIKNIPSGQFANTLLSVTDNSGVEVALVTLKGDADNKTTLIIDSETEECTEEYSDGQEVKEKDASEKVSLNGKNFPVLKDGKTNILLSQYEREDYKVPSYNVVLANKQSTCESIFSTQDDTIKSFEDKYIIRPFNTLIKERENSFNAESYASRLTDLCDKGIHHGNVYYALSYTIENPNNYLNGITIECKHENYSNDLLSEFNKYGLSYLEMVRGSPDTTQYVIKVKDNADGTNYVCYVKNSDGKLVKYSGGEIIITRDDVPAEKVIEKEIFPDVATSINDSLPNFITASVGLDGNIIKSISYTFKITTSDYGNNPVTIYWKDKVGITGLLGKAGWNDCTNGTSIVNYIWSTISKKFTINGQFLSSSAGYNIRFACFNTTSEEDLQYDFGVNSSKLFEVVLVSATSIKINKKYNGFYNYNGVAWISPTDETPLIDTLSLTESFTIEYLRDLPKYSNESDWPEWLNNTPVYFKNNTQCSTDLEKLNAEYIKFKVNRSTYYRTYELANEVETPGNFYKLDEGECIKEKGNTSTDLKIFFSEQVTIGQYWTEVVAWKNPSDVPAFPFDRLNKIDGATPSLDDPLPNWLSYEVEMTVKFYSKPDATYVATKDNVVPLKWLVNNTSADIPNSFYVKDHWYADVNSKIFDSDGNEIGIVTIEPTIYFYSGTGQGGFYKYDNSSAWVYHSARTGQADNMPIIKIGYKDTVTFYYVESMDANSDYLDYYDSHREEDKTWMNYLTPTLKPGGTQNPLSVEFKIKNGVESGYYKANSLVNWKKYSVDETVLETLVSEQNTISHLKPSENISLDDVQIIITPKWWML